MISALAYWRTRARVQRPPASRRTLITRSDVVSRGAVVGLPALDASWFDAEGRPIAVIVALAIIAVVSLIVAAAAHGREHPRTRSEHDEADLFTTTPLPMSQEELARMRREAKEARRRVSEPGRLPRWVKLGSVLVACGFTYIAAQRLRVESTETAGVESSTMSEARAADGPAELVDDSPESLDLAPDSAPFSFRAREFVAMDGGCTGRLEVTKGAPAPLTLTARVHDDRGQLIGTARARVETLQPGDVVDFRFRRTACDRIGAWDVRGDRRTP